MIGRIIGFSQFGDWDGQSSDRVHKVVLFLQGRTALDRLYQRDDKSINTWTGSYIKVIHFYSDRKVPYLEFIYD